MARTSSCATSASSAPSAWVSVELGDPAGDVELERVAGDRRRLEQRARRVRKLPDLVSDRRQHRPRQLPVAGDGAAGAAAGVPVRASWRR